MKMKTQFYQVFCLLNFYKFLSTLGIAIVQNVFFSDAGENAI